MRERRVAAARPCGQPDFVRIVGIVRVVRRAQLVGILGLARLVWRKRRVHDTRSVRFARRRYMRERRLVAAGTRAKLELVGIVGFARLLRIARIVGRHWRLHDAGSVREPLDAR
ncbi:hypothetical protein WB334_25695, partial [Escherichia coli]|uniref:hypothetical protein n=1 Tax=Escherichia coli TaxID=562 RepID=UPI002157524C